MHENMPMGVRFSIISRAFKKQIDSFMAEEDLTGVQFGVLTQLNRLSFEKDYVNQRDLELALNVTHPTMTEILKKLEKKDYITTSPAPEDKRRKNIFATAKTDGLLSSLNEIDNSAFKELSRGLTSEQITLLEEMTDIMLGNILACPERKHTENV